MVISLVQSSAADMPNGLGETPLMAAAYHGHEAVVLALLDFHARTDRKNRWGDTALSLAKMQGHEGIVHLLSHAGAKP